MNVTVLMIQTTKGYLDTIKRTMLFEQGKVYVVPESLGKTLVKSGYAVYSATVRDTLYYFRDTRQNIAGYRPLTDAEWEQR